MEKKRDILSPYMLSIHRTGRMSTIITILSFIGAGLLLCWHFGYFPSLGVFLNAAVPVFIMVTGAGFGEYLAYVPVLGPGAAYISFITGNLANMKLPSIMGSMNALEVEEDSEEFHVLSVIAAVTASLLVIVLLGIVVLFSSQIRPVLEWEPLQPAITNISPVLYAILISSSARKRPMMCLCTGVLLVPVILYINPLTNGTAGALGGMVIAALLSVWWTKHSKMTE